MKGCATRLTCKKSVKVITSAGVQWVEAHNGSLCPSLNQPKLLGKVWYALFKRCHGSAAQEDATVGTVIGLCCVSEHVNATFQSSKPWALLRVPVGCPTHILRLVPANRSSYLQWRQRVRQKYWSAHECFDKGQYESAVQATQTLL